MTTRTDLPPARLTRFVDPVLLAFPGLLLLLYTYALFWASPYLGFEWNPADGTVVNLWFVRDPGLRVGDRVLSLGDMSFAAFQSDLRQSVPGHNAGRPTIPLVIQRDGQTLTLDWPLPGQNPIEVRERIFSQWWLAWLFWGCALLTYLLLRPRDARWRLLTAFHSLTAVWLMASALSRWHTWESAIVLRAAMWMCIPVYWHLHWLFPSPLRRLPRVVWAGAYGLAAALVIAQWFQWLPGSLYGLGFLLALTGVLAPLLWRLRLPEHRRPARFLLGAALLATVPPAVFGVLAVAGLVSVASATSLLALPILPLFYFYAAYRRQLGPLEIRANRLISLYLFLTLLVVLASVLIPVLMPFVPIEGGHVIVGIMATAAGGLMSLVGFAPFQRWAERRLLGVPPAAGRLLETYSQRIATCASHDALAALLRDEILPGLLVRQSALVLVEAEAPPQPLYAIGVNQSELPSANDVAPLLSEAGRFRFASHEHRACPWARVVVPLSIAWNTTGLWLLGRRDPDDFYGQAEINALLSLAGQTAVALTNILQAEQLRALYRADVNQREAERARLAHELHDQVLNQMAVLRTSLGAEPDSPEFQRAYAAVVASLRQTIGDLRPAMLDYGLFSALKALADDLADRAGAQPQVVLEVPASDARFDPVIEQHLYRIIQQACANTLQHARARTLRISGTIAPHEVKLQVEDDGQGFAAGGRLLLSDLIARRHYGLAGMQERATLSDAQLFIQSSPSGGTRIQILWHATR